MSISTDVRFRPVAPLDGDAQDPHAAARDRWTQALEGRVGVESYEFKVTGRGAPLERPEAQRYAAGTKPTDLTIRWASLEDANKLFTDNRLFEYLCGFVAAAPAVHVEGRDQVQDQPTA